jgi:uncharacterized protein (DUF4415 family)
MNAKLPNTPRSLTDWNTVDAHIIAEHEYDEAPELIDEMLAIAEVSKGETLIHAGNGPLTKALRGRPKSRNPKEQRSVRFSPEVLDYFRATGKGWQTRMDEALKEWIARH